MRICLLPITLTLVACSSHSSETPASPAGVEPRITQFYASPPTVPKGEKSLLCYGVEGATALELVPPVEEVKPALTRCFDVHPTETTSYKLTARNDKGATVSQEVQVTVGGAAPKLFDLSINANQVAKGGDVNFCFQARNATAVSGSPGRFLRGGNPQRDCLTDKPVSTTTYTITVSNKDGVSDSASMEVRVK